MSEVSFVSNENNAKNVTTVVMPMAEVEYEDWRTLNTIHIESLQAQLPRSDWDRIDDITKTTDLATYRERRVHPNTQAGEDGWKEKQIFTRPRIAISRDGSNQIIGAVLTANNTSGKGSAWKAEAGLKMIMSPDLPENFPLPKFGGKRYVHLREAYIHPDAQEAVQVEDGTIPISGIILKGLYRSLDKYKLRQKVSAYVAEGDVADREFEHLTQAIGLMETDREVNKLAGYTAEEKVRSALRVVDVMRNILDMPYIGSGNFYS